MGMQDSDLTRRYLSRNNESQKLHRRAEQSMPGGDTRSVTYTSPFPTYFEEASGARMTSVDGDTVIDFLNNYTQAIHGHAPKPVVEAVTNRFAAGNGFGSPTTETIELAERLIDRIPSIEHIRFCNSGTEATMNALRAAMAYTGREKIVKVSGGYHGTHDSVEVSIKSKGRTHVGIPKTVEERVIAVPFNDSNYLKRTFERHGQDIAGFVLEPMLGAAGMIPAEQDYIEVARDLTYDADSLLIFDEVMTSRLSYGGAQQVYGVIPDLTALGKYIGGGLPIGAFGGRKDIMSVFHPIDGDASHSGTFNGNPATMTGGIVTLDLLDKPSIKTINKKGKTIREEIQEVVKDYQIPVQVTGMGSLFHIHFTDGPVVDAASAGSSQEEIDTGISHQFYLAMRDEGIFMAPRGMGNVSTPMKNSDIKKFIKAANISFDTINGLSEQI